MELLMAATAQVSIVLGVALGAVTLLRRRSAALRHWILTVAVVSALAAPLLEAALPSWTLPAIPSRWTTSIVTPGTLAVFESIVSEAPQSVSNLDAGTRWLPVGLTLRSGLLGLWGFGALAALLILLARLTQLKHLARAATPVSDSRWRQLLAATAHQHGVRRRIGLVHGASPAMVVTWGVLRPRILVPEEACRWTDARIRVVLSHEVAHIRRNDWMVQVAAAVVTSLYWFHPLAWIAARALRREAERACDDRVLNGGVSGSEYATHLLGVARDATRLRRQWSAAAAVARPSTLEGRIRAMLNARMNRDPLTRRGRIAAVALGAFVALAAATSSIGAAAQSGVGSIAVVLYDQAGGLLPGVAVNVAQVETARAYTSKTTTDRTGSFAIRDVPAGVYELTMSLPGFATVKATVDVRPGDRLQRSVVLPLGTIEETLTVIGGAQDPIAAAPRPVREIPPPRGPASSVAGGVGGSIKVPRKIVDVKPRYPAELDGTGAAATVTLSGRIGIDGYVLDLKDVSATPGHPAFLASALEASRQWEFNPTLLNGAPVETNITITIRYRSE